MNLTVRVLFDPDPNPGFIVTVRAIDQAGDGCNGLVGITHQHCVPGATPRFQIDFQNPASPNAGAAQPARPQGRLQLPRRADRRQPVHRRAGPDLHHPGRRGAGRPARADVLPDRQLPSGLRCARLQGQPGAGLARPELDRRRLRQHVGHVQRVHGAERRRRSRRCTPHTIATITGAGTCTSDSQLPDRLLRHQRSACARSRPPARARAARNARSNAFCDTTTHLCTFNSQPVYIGSALGADNFQSFIRMSIGLSATAPYTQPPVLHRWELTYLCNQLL